MRRSLFPVLVLLLALYVVLGATPRASFAANSNVGYVDFSFGSAIGVDPTADKPQSKLWFNDSRWWAIIFDTGSSTWHIYKLNWPSQWVDTGTVVDDRPTSRADALWDGAHLYVASLVRFSAANQGEFYRFSYDAGAKTYSLDSGFPVTIMTGSAETLAIDKDSTGQFWIAFTQGKKVYVNRSTSGDAIWGTPFVVPGPTSATSVASDDIASLVAYQDQNGSSIGVVWSNQNTPSSMYFSYHKDSDADNVWQPVAAIYSATCAADDHINLKSLQSDASGAIYAAVKTSFGDSGCGGSSSSPLIRLVVRRPNNTWAVATFGTVGDDHTRPLVLLDTTNRKVYMFATSPTACGVIYMKSSSMDNLNFPTGKGTPFISSSTYTCINNATSTKRTVDASTGLVVMASDENKSYYLHNVLSLGSAPPDTTPPTVTNKTPAANASAVDLATSVTATFSEPVTGVGSNSFTLTAAGGAAVAASVTYDSATQVATLRPNTSLAPNTTYTVALTAGITDGMNNALAPVSWNFTTASAPPSDTTPPTVVATTPASGATNVNIASSATATFSEALDASTVTGANVSLSGPSGAVAASVAYDTTSKTVTLQPSASLAASTAYTAQVSGVKDPAGNMIAAPYTWSFSTAATPPPSSWSSLDIGTATNGSTSATGTSITVNGSGSDIWSSADSFRYVYQAASGDVVLTAKLTQWVGGGNAWAKGGLMLRASTAANAANCLVDVTGGKGLHMQWRAGNGGSSSITASGISFAAPSPSAPLWLRLSKSGSSCSAAYATDGTNWLPVGAPQTISGLGSSYLAGLAVTAHDPSKLATATFDTISSILVLQ